MAWPIVACTALCLLVPRPGYADPGNNTVPDSGAPPVASAPLGSTGAAGTAPVVAPVVGPLGSQIMAEQSAIEALGEQLKQAQIDASAAHDATVSAQQAWQEAQANAAALRQRANTAAAEAYKKAESLGPFDEYAEVMHQLGVLAPGFADGTPGGVAGSRTAAQDATRAEALAQHAYQAYQAALDAEQQKDRQRDQLAASYNQRSASLDTLKTNNTRAVAQAEAAQEATDERLAAQFAAGSNVDGMVAGPAARKAISFALSQLGAPYNFAHEGPYHVGYDCSGLVWAAYRSAGIDWLPRIAKDQYHSTTKIDVTKLLPGDLVFFSTVSTTDWTTISHVGIYLGDNKMIEAPHTGDVVKIATVWWSAFFGATRVVPAVPQSPTPTPTPTPTVAPSPLPSISLNPRPTPPGKTTAPILPHPTPSSPSPSSPSPSSPTSPPTNSATSQSPSPAPGPTPTPLTGSSAPAAATTSESPPPPSTSPSVSTSAG